jgi:hypothetical protein
MKMIGKKMTAFLERLAAANKASLGSDRLDCCTLDKAPRPKTSHPPK